MQSPDERLRPCRKCGALNGKGFDRCVRCNASLAAIAASTEALKSKVGGSVDSQNLLATMLLIGLTALVFVGQIGPGIRAGDFMAIAKGGTSAELRRYGALIISLSDAQESPYRLLSAVFVHFGALHFLMNMMALWSTGRVVEPAIGSARFVFAYLMCGFLGFAANIGIVALFPHEGGALTAGASGAVFGTMGMTLGWLIRIRDRRWRTFAAEIVFYAVVVNLLVRVNNGAHVGGLLVGVAFGFYFASHPRPKTFVVANIGAIVGLLLVIASLLLSQRAAGWGRTPDPFVGALSPAERPLDPSLRACPSVPPFASPTPAASGAYACFTSLPSPIDSSSKNVV